MDLGSNLNLEEAKAAWILGDWDRLAHSQQSHLADIVDRELLALLIGAACLRLGNNEKGRLLIEQAKVWGCPSRLIAQVLVAGVHFSLGRAELLRHESQKSHLHILAAIQSVSLREPMEYRYLGNSAGMPMHVFGEIPVLDVSELGTRLGSTLLPPAPSKRQLNNWVMVRDDGPILRYLFEVHQSKRHLEFGTWQGWGTCLCLEATAATVWTINLPDGETKPDGSWAYGERVDNAPAPPGAVTVTFGDNQTGPIVYHRTDAGSYIGRLYREKELAHRVCQIFCDSRNWDTSAYPTAFFDSVFIDGGHQTDVVISDTRKALSVLRSGGMIIWHDFCPIKEICAQNSLVREVTGILEALLPEIGSLFSQLNWINPSMILFGIKK
jgi:predicted O-methyltransferase YrrM